MVDNKDEYALHSGISTALTELKVFSNFSIAMFNLRQCCANVSASVHGFGSSSDEDESVSDIFDQLELFGVFQNSFVQKNNLFNSFEVHFL